MYFLTNTSIIVLPVNFNMKHWNFKLTKTMPLLNTVMQARNSENSNKLKLNRSYSIQASRLNKSLQSTSTERNYQVKNLAAIWGPPTRLSVITSYTSFNHSISDLYCCVDCCICFYHNRVWSVAEHIRCQPKMVSSNWWRIPALRHVNQLPLGRQIQHYGQTIS
jgi:hypothetical protein